MHIPKHMCTFLGLYYRRENVLPIVFFKDTFWGENTIVPLLCRRKFDFLMVTVTDTTIPMCVDSDVLVEFQNNTMTLFYYEDVTLPTTLRQRSGYFQLHCVLQYLFIDVSGLFICFLVLLIDAVVCSLI